MILKSFRLPLALCAFAGILAASLAQAQVTALDRQLQRIDVAVSGDGVATKGASGTNYQGTAVSLSTSTTVGAVVQIRYIKAPLLGLEGTYTYARFTEHFTAANGAGVTFPSSPFLVQAGVSEYSLGYVAHLPSLLGVKPFASVGVGATAFTPTPLGGQGLPERSRLTEYYSAGVDDELGPHFGLRVQLRQTFYRPPDFDANYLRFGGRSFTTEPAVGFYVKF